MPDLMRKVIHINITEQPDDVTCGPSCLYSVYRYYGRKVELGEVISSVSHLREGGCLAPHLGVDALMADFSATIYAFNINIFDPTWFSLDSTDLYSKLKKQFHARTDPKLRFATKAYMKFLELGGVLKFDDLTPELIETPLRKDHPIICGLSSTYLYRASREIPSNCEDDDINGEPAGHFVILAGCNLKTKEVDIADPYKLNPISPGQVYRVSESHLLCAILLGVVTYDANLLIISPK